MGEEDPNFTEDERDLVRLAAAYGFDLHRPGEKYADDPAATKGLLVDHYRKLKTKLAEAESKIRLLERANEEMPVFAHMCLERATAAEARLAEAERKLDEMVRLRP